MKNLVNIFLGTILVHYTKSHHMFKCGKFNACYSKTEVCVKGVIHKLRQSETIIY